jgi:glycosyltransferase-like protein
MRRLRIAMLTYSLRPRGGVVHALEVSEALARRGHEVRLMALGRPHEQFFRDPAVDAEIVRYEPREGPYDERILGMLARYRDGLAQPLADGAFDVIHAQDCLSANAALELRDLGVIPHVIRTVHHVDQFTSQSLIDCQDRSILEPDALVCVSEPWVGRLAEAFGVSAGLVRNGVDRARYRPPVSGAERARDRAVAGFDHRLTVLTVGGIEPRKGTLTLLDGFAEVCEQAGDLDPLLVIAGGATLFDYRHEVDRFHARLAELGLEDHVRLLGSVSCEELERLYRAADVFAFPSTTEGFGLAALEALASGLPVVASELDAFTTFLEHDRNAMLVPVGDSAALARAVVGLARNERARARLRREGLIVAETHGWDAAAIAHERVYGELVLARDDDRLVSDSAGRG